MADSIERVRAVRQAIQTSTSGKSRPTTRRSQTKTAFGPVSAAKGSPPGMPVASHVPKSSSWTTMAQKRMRVVRTRGRSEMRGVTRYQCASTTAAIDPPVTTARASSCTSRGTASGSPAVQPQAASAMAATPAAMAAPPSQRARPPRAQPERRPAARAPRTGRWPPGAARRARRHSRWPAPTGAGRPHSVASQPRPMRPARTALKPRKPAVASRDLAQQPGEARSCPGPASRAAPT